MNNNQKGFAALVVLLLVLGTALPASAQEKRLPATDNSTARTPLPPALTETGHVAQAQQTPATQTQTGTATPSPPEKPAPVLLTSKQKLRYGAALAFLTPSAYVSPAVNAFFVERRDVKALGKTGEDKFADGLPRFARAFATRSSAELLGAGVYPALFKQNPIYQPSGRHGFMARAGYAASRALVTSGDNGKTQPNFSRLLGNLTSASLANVYERDTVKRRDAQGRVLEYNRRVGVGPTMELFAINTGLDALSHVLFDEFNILAKLQKKLSRKPQDSSGP